MLNAGDAVQAAAISLCASMPWCQGDTALSCKVVKLLSLKLIGWLWHSCARLPPAQHLTAGKDPRVVNSRHAVSRIALCYRGVLVRGTKHYGTSGRAPDHSGLMPAIDGVCRPAARGIRSTGKQPRRLDLGPRGKAARVKASSSQG
jgi:hypothetical protein